MTAVQVTRTRASSGAGQPTGSTPYLELDLDVAAARFERLARSFPDTALHYAVKANPHPALLSRLHRAGARFDVASPAEVDACHAAGAAAGDLLYSNPVKRRADVVHAHRLGVRTFVIDSPLEAVKVAAAAPGADVLCRLSTSGAGSDWPLSDKFGVGPVECVQILEAAARLGLGVAGVCFHVGSQQHEPRRWESPIRQAAAVFRALRERGHRPWLLDMGGGLPAGHVGRNPEPAEYAREIERHLRKHFGGRRPRTVLEPGRAVVGDAGTIVSSVVGVCWRGDRRWVYLDVGVFTGLVETLGEAIRYRIDTPGRSGPCGPAVLAGPTCDSADVMYAREPVQLPLSLHEGDVVRLHATGAYTTCYSTVGFNGFAPLPTRLVTGTIPNQAGPNHWG